MEWDPDRKADPEYGKIVRDYLEMDANLPPELIEFPRLPDELVPELQQVLDRLVIDLPDVVDRDPESGLWHVYVFEEETQNLGMKFLYNLDLETPADDRMPWLLLIVEELGEPPFDRGAYDKGGFSLKGLEIRVFGPVSKGGGKFFEETGFLRLDGVQPGASYGFRI